MEKAKTCAKLQCMSDAEFYRNHLERVSRSFSFCIARLEGEMKEWVSLSYLLCRILDTVEDAPWKSFQQQKLAYDRFSLFLLKMPEPSEVSAWLEDFPPLPEGEKLLLADSFRCFSLFHGLRQPLRVRIYSSIKNMASGMKYFSERSINTGTLRLENLTEVNQYCFFVAGIVGHLLTDLVRAKWPQSPHDPKFLRDAHHFGLFLQKINILKDQTQDEKEGRFFVPSRSEILRSLRLDAEGAVRYLKALPVAERGFRLFCAFSLFLGLASLPWIERSKLMGLFQKIPRLFTEQLLSRVEGLIDDNTALGRLFMELLPSSNETVGLQYQKGALPSWFASAYEGELSPADFQQLGMLAP